MQQDHMGSKTLLSRTEYQTLKKAEMKKNRVAKFKKDVSGVVLATAILTTATTTSAARFSEYTVNDKDTFYKLSQQFGVTVEYLQQINGKNDGRLLIGEKIFVPQTNDPYTERVVKAGDTWSHFSKEVNVPVKELLKLNNRTSDVLYINETILLPSEAIKSSKTAVQVSKAIEKENIEVRKVVQKGESLWKIAREYRTTIDEIRAANNLKNNKIKIGQELVIKNITQSSVIIVGAADSNFVEFKQPNKESIVLKVTPFHSIDQFSAGTGKKATIQYNEEKNELISFEVH